MARIYIVNFSYIEFTASGVFCIVWYLCSPESPPSRQLTSLKAVLTPCTGVKLITGICLIYFCCLGHSPPFTVSPAITPPPHEGSSLPALSVPATSGWLGWGNPELQCAIQTHIIGNAIQLVTAIDWFRNGHVTKAVQWKGMSGRLCVSSEKRLVCFLLRRMCPGQLIPIIITPRESPARHWSQSIGRRSGPRLQRVKENRPFWWEGLEHLEPRRAQGTWSWVSCGTLQLSYSVNSVCLFVSLRWVSPDFQHLWPPCFISTIIACNLPLIYSIIWPGKSISGPF